jgi:hypothetical protein
MKRIAQISLPLAVGALIPWVFNWVVALIFMTPGIATALRWLEASGMPVQMTIDVATHTLPLLMLSYVAGRIVFGAVGGNRPFQILLCSAGWFAYGIDNVIFFCFSPGMSCLNPPAIFDFVVGFMLVPLGLALALVHRKGPPSLDKAVDTDAQGRSPAPPSPDLRRRSHLR